VKLLRIRLVEVPDTKHTEHYVMVARPRMDAGQSIDMRPGVLEFFDTETGVATPVEILL
jgi:hypothetical protein